MSVDLNYELNLRQNEYHGVVLPDKDPKNQGRYKIHIPELHPLIKENKGIWCKNQNHKWRIGPSEDYVYGSYYPLQPGTKVIVKFDDNDFHSGYVDRIISDQVIKTTPKIGCGVNPEATCDRDDIYIFFKTPKYHNLFAILEKTTDGQNGLTKQLIPNSLHLYYNYRRSTYIMNEDGIHLFSMNNYGKTIEGHNSVWINQNDKLYVQGNRDVYTNGNYKKFTKGNIDHLGKGSCRNTYTEDVDFQSTDTHFAVDAPAILLNCGATKPAQQAETNKGEDEIVKQNKLDMRIVPHQKRDDTYYGSPPNATVGGAPPLPKMEGDKTLSAIPQGQSDRYSSVGKEQVGIDLRPYPPYPNRGGMTFMVNLPAISSAISAPLSQLKGLSLSGLTSSVTAPILSKVTSTTNAVASKASSAITAATSGLTGAVTSGLKNSVNLNITNNLINKMSSLTSGLSSIPGYNALPSLPSSLTSELSSVKSIIGNANSIQDLNNRINSRLNSYVSSTITSPVTSVISDATFGVNSIKRAIETQNVANMITDMTGTTNIGGRVVAEINSLTNGSFITGVLGHIPGATAAASLINLVSNTMGLGGIMSDIICNEPTNFELALDNPLDAINARLENLKKSLEAMANAFDPNSLASAIKDNLNLEAIQNALNSLGQGVNCQSIVRATMNQSAVLNSAATSAKPTKWFS